jgi:hypothetical protein
MIKNMVQTAQKKQNESIKREREMLLDILLKKVGLKKKDIVDFALQEWVAGNLEMLTPSEKKQFKYLAIK